MVMVGPCILRVGTYGLMMERRYIYESIIFDECHREYYCGHRFVCALGMSHIRSSTGDKTMRPQS